MVSTYLGFLRAINLGAKRTFPKDDIRAAVESAGFTGVETHINTGNVRFDTSMRSRARIEAALEKAFLADRGFDVPTIVFTVAEFADLAREVAALAAARPGLARHYVDLLKDELDPEDAARVEALSADGLEIVVRGRAVHTLLGAPYSTGAFALPAGRMIGLATNRNATVVRAVAAKWC